MNFTEVVNNVISLTARPDKAAEIGIAVNKALSFFILRAEFAQDIIEETFPIDPALYGDTVSIATLTRFRKFQYVKRTGDRSYLSPIGSDKVFTPGSQMQKDVYFVAGTNLTYVLRSAAPSLELAYFTYPPILSGVDIHWFLDVMPWPVIDKAAANIFKNIGDDASWRSHEATSMEMYLNYRRSIKME